MIKLFIILLVFIVPIYASPCDDCRQSLKEHWNSNIARMNMERNCQGLCDAEDNANSHSDSPNMNEVYRNQDPYAPGGPLYGIPRLNDNNRNDDPSNPNIEIKKRLQDFLEIISESLMNQFDDLNDYFNNLEAYYSFQDTRKFQYMVKKCGIGKMYWPLVDNIWQVVLKEHFEEIRMSGQDEYEE